MIDYNNNIKKYALALALTPGILWFVGGILGVYFRNGSAMLFLSAFIIGGLPIITALIASRFNIAGSLLLIIEAAAVMFLIYANGISTLIFIVIFLSYGLPIILSAFTFIGYWYKNKTRI